MIVVMRTYKTKSGIRERLFEICHARSCRRRFSICLLTLAVVSAPAGVSTGAQQTVQARDGASDFDWEIGAWRTRVQRLRNPLSRSTTWLEYEGTTIVQRLLDGRSNVAELRLRGPAGSIAGVSLRLYNPQQRQWSLHYANIADGQLTPPAVGAFRGGRGEFFAKDTFQGRQILVRFVISEITARSARFEQAFSDDGGRIWEVNWIATDSRIEGEPPRATR